MTRTRWSWRTVADPWAPTWAKRRIPSPLADRYGYEVEVLCRGSNGNLLLRFVKDGHLVVAPRWAAKQIPGVDLIRPIPSIAWELRAAWAKGWRVSLSIAADEQRIEGHVKTVSATDAFVVVGTLHVPLVRVLAVHRPSRLGDSDYQEEQEGWRGRVPPGAQHDPRQRSLPGF